jgi:hypothetical protein
MRECKSPSERESRIEWWRRLIFRQQSAPVPLTQFCRQMGINARKFYYWRQRLREMDAASSCCQVSPSKSPRPASAIVTGTAATFVPVSIVNPGTATQLEIELANGCAVRLTGSIDPGLLQAAITAAGKLNGSGQGDR